MTMLLRTVLVLVSLLTTLVIMRKIRQSKMRIEDSVFWIGFLFLLILFSIFPQIVFLMSDMTGTQTPVNFIFLFVIFVLILRIFRLTVKISQLETKVRDLVQKIAIDENLEREGRLLNESGETDRGIGDAGEKKAGLSGNHTDIMEKVE